MIKLKNILESNLPPSKGSYSGGGVGYTFLENGEVCPDCECVDCECDNNLNETDACPECEMVDCECDNNLNEADACPECEMVDCECEMNEIMGKWSNETKKKVKK